MSGAELTVRRADPDDAESIVAVLVAVAEEGRWIGTEAPVDVPARLARVRDGLVSGADVVWTLEARGEVVGTLGLHATSAAGVLALGVAIVVGWRGRGGGGLLLRAGLAHAVAAPAHKVELEVWPDNARAIALYRRHGFAVEGLRRDHWRRRDGTLRSTVLMARPVVGPEPPPAVLGDARPVLLVDDVDAALAFYRDRLGFRDIASGTPRGVAAVSRDGATVLLARAPDGADRRAPPPPWDVYVQVSTGVDTLHDELRRRGAPIAPALRDTPHGVREFGTQDLDGHRIGFGQPLER